MRGKTVAPNPETKGASPEPLIVRQEDPGVIRLLGADGLDLLHRITTNALLDLSAGQARPTILTNALGRIIDVVSVLHAGDDLLLVTSPDRGQAVQEWIQSYIFFQDDVVLENETGGWAEIGVFADGAAEALSDLIAIPSPPEGEALAESGHAMVWQAAGPLAGYRILLPADQLAARQDAWARSPEQGRAAYRARRIAAGVPASGQELSEEVTPLDVGLADWVSFDKGCYIGQEVIARMESRGQRRWRLVRLTLTGEAAEGSALMDGERKAGTLTSVAHHPRLGWIGLGLIHARQDNASGRWQVDGVQAEARPDAVQPERVG